MFAEALAESSCRTRNRFPNRLAWPSLPNTLDELVAAIVFGKVRLAAVNIVIPNNDLDAGRTINVLDHAAFDGDVYSLLRGSLCHSSKVGPMGPVLSQFVKGLLNQSFQHLVLPAVLLSSPTTVHRSP